MIRFENVSKSYGTFRAIRSISFELEKGRVTGFLGPNGAGKTTTMRMMTGYLRQDAGTVTIEGRTHERDSLAIRQRLGYLAENSPLYPDMTVAEYLEMTGRFRGLRKTELKKAVAEMVAVCGLSENLKKAVGALSKGYRQRLGLAQAMIHQPEILILDEPTTGLDPNQIAQIKDLINTIGQEKTLILSTHILHHVPELCDRVLVLDRGALVFDGTAREFARGESEPVAATLLVDRDEAEARHALCGLSFVERVVFVDRDGPFYQYRLTGRLGPENMARLFQTVADRSWRVARCAPEPETLDRIFERLTQKDRHETNPANR